MLLLLLAGLANLLKLWVHALDEDAPSLVLHGGTRGDHLSQNVGSSPVALKLCFHCRLAPLHLTQLLKLSLSFLLLCCLLGFLLADLLLGASALGAHLHEVVTVALGL
jgi:hypothetical protein